MNSEHALNVQAGVVASGISVLNGAVLDVRIPVEALGIGGIRYNCVSGNPAADSTFIPPRAHQRQLRVTVATLTREGEVRL